MCAPLGERQTWNWVPAIFHESSFPFHQEEWHMKLELELRTLTFHWNLRSKYYFMIMASPFLSCSFISSLQIMAMTCLNLIQPAFPCWVVKSFTCETLHLSYSFSPTSLTFKNYLANVSPEVCVFCNMLLMESPLKLCPLNPSFIWQVWVWAILCFNGLRWYLS